MPTFHVSQSPMAATPPNRKFARISATLWLPKTKLGHVHRDSVRSGQNKFGVICPLGGAIINKIAFLLISLIVKITCSDTPDSSSVRRELAWEPEGRRFESSDRRRRFRFELTSWELFDVSIIPLIARLAWAPHCCLQLYLLLFLFLLPWDVYGSP